MNKVSRFAFVAALAGFASAAYSYQYSFLASGDLGLTGVSNGQQLTVGGGPIGNQGDTSNNQIDFFPGGPGLVVGDSSGTGFRSYSFTYMVMAPSPTVGVGLTVLGSISGTGRISMQEDIFRMNADNSETLVSTMANTIFVGGSVDNRGNYTENGANYTYVDNANLSQGLIQYKVKKSFFLQVTNWGTSDFNKAVDYASIALIQQIHKPVPEPATMAALAIGSLGLIARRRRNRS